MPYVEQARLADGTPVLVPCAQNNGFGCGRRISQPRSRRERAGSCSTIRSIRPGVVYSADELAAFAEALLAHPQVWVLADGLYEHIVFDGRRAPTIAEVAPRLRERTLTVSGVAKATP